VAEIEKSQGGSNIITYYEEEEEKDLSLLKKMTGCPHPKEETGEMHVNHQKGGNHTQE